MSCEFGPCTAPDTNCPHWQGTFCEIDVEKERQENNGVMSNHNGRFCQ